MLSIASTRIVASILLAGFLPGAKASCSIDSYVYQYAYPRPPRPAQLNHLFLSPPLTTLGMALKPVVD